MIETRCDSYPRPISTIDFGVWIRLTPMTETASYNKEIRSVGGPGRAERTLYRRPLCYDVSCTLPFLSPSLVLLVLFQSGAPGRTRVLALGKWG